MLRAAAWGMAWCVSLGVGLRRASSGCAKLRVLRRPRPVLTPRRRARAAPEIEIASARKFCASADVAAAAMPKRCRSKGVVRAAKRRAFTLRSQNLPDDDALAAPTTRGDRIAEAMKRGSSDAAAAWPDCDAWRRRACSSDYKLQRVVERHDWCAPIPHARLLAPIATCDRSGGIPIPAVSSLASSSMQDRAPSRRGESAPLAHACADAGRWLHREAFSHTQPNPPRAAARLAARSPTFFLSSGKPSSTRCSGRSTSRSGTPTSRRPRTSARASATSRRGRRAARRGGSASSTAGNSTLTSTLCARCPARRRRRPRVGRPRHRR